LAKQGPGPRPGPSACGPIGAVSRLRPCPAPASFPLKTCPEKYRTWVVA